LLGWTKPSLMRGGRTVKQYSETFVGFDVAKAKHAVAIAEGSRGGEIRFLGTIENTPIAIERTIEKLAESHGRLHVCFEAGSTGCGLYRQIRELGHDCMVVAPALIPQRPGSGLRPIGEARSRWRGCMGLLS
jgi:transposase